MPTKPSLVGTTTTVAPESLNLYHRNPRRGDIPAIASSLRAHDQYKPLVVNVGSLTGRPSEVLAGNHTLEAIRSLAAQDPDDPRWRSVKVHWVDVDDEKTRQIVLVDNRTSELGGYDITELYDLLKDVPVADLPGVGYTSADLDSLAHSATTDLDAITDALNNAAKTPVTKRNAPLDMAFSFTNFSLARAAYYIGWGPGVISSSNSTSRWRAYLRESPKAPALMFMDNEWHDYDHSRHVAAAQEFSPKYATTRDIMTKQQCDEAGVQYLTFDEIMDQAADVAKYAANVIVIPKHNILDKIPDTIGGKRVVLGYSVPSKYGRTDIHPAEFVGRPVHLLGGSWKVQRTLLTMLGDDVVSLDMNQMARAAEFGQVVTREGEGYIGVSDLPPMMSGGKHRTWVAALMLSLTVIMNEVIDIFGVEPPAVELEVTDDDFGGDR